MKKVMITILALMCGLSSFGQDLTFDFPAKKWTTSAHKQNKYLLVKYKAQPRILITGLPADYKTEVSETQYDVVPQTETKEGLKKDEKDKAVDTITHLMKNVDADEVEYQVVVKDKGDKEVLKFTSMAKVYGRWKIDVSSGVIFNIGLNDESYYYEASGEDQSILREDDDKNVISPTVALITHFYKSGKGYVNYGGAFGLGIDDDGKTGWYFGLGALLGDRQRIAISGGIAWRQVKQLKSQYQSMLDSGAAVDNADKVDTADLLEESYQQGWFVSFSYNLSSTVTKK
jgi:hypothetical protein